LENPCVVCSPSPWTSWNTLLVAWSTSASGTPFWRSAWLEHEQIMFFIFMM
jgi:hypothetical protein